MELCTPGNSRYMRLNRACPRGKRNDEIDTGSPHFPASYFHTEMNLGGRG